MLLTQRQPFKGTRVFEIVDDVIYVSIKTIFRKEKLTIALSKLNPEPVINGHEMAFHDSLE